MGHHSHGLGCFLHAADNRGGNDIVARLQPCNLDNQTILLNDGYKISDQIVQLLFLPQSQSEECGVHGACRYQTGRA